LGPVVDGVIGDANATVHPLTLALSPKGAEHYPQIRRTKVNFRNLLIYDNLLPLTLIWKVTKQELRNEFEVSKRERG
jgi:hypothetical protein